MSDQALSHCTFRRTKPLYMPITNTTISATTTRRMMAIMRPPREPALHNAKSIRCADAGVKRERFHHFAICYTWSSAEGSSCELTPVFSRVPGRLPIPRAEPLQVVERVDEE